MHSALHGFGRRTACGATSSSIVVLLNDRFLWR
jgi:hypothetical protein